MKKTIYSLFIMCLLLETGSLTATEFVAGYYPSWMREVLPASQIDVDRLTHILHAFAWPTAEGTIEHDANFLFPELNERVHANGRFILLSLGGWGQSDGFAPMAADPAIRKTFIQNVMTFCLEHNYDGVDMDWEHPSTPQERDNMTVLVKDLRAEFSKLLRPQPLYISMAVTASNWNGQWLDYDELKKVVDWFGCMTYDFHGDWTNHAGHNSPLYMSGGDMDGSVNSGFNYLTKTRGLPLEQILLGVPFYGRGFNASELYGESTGTGSEHGYKEIPALIESGWTRHWDNDAKVPYIINPQKTKLISYDDTISVRLKAEYAITKKVKGVMIWALGQDVIDGEQPLVNAAADPILNRTTIGKNNEKSPNDFDLLRNYPNPFNGQTTIVVNLPARDTMSLSLLDLRGQTVKTIYQGDIAVGEHRFKVMADDLSSGVFLCRLSLNSILKIHKITHLK